MITKGIRISQLVERKDLNGKEIIPFQDGIHNGKLSIQSLIDYIGDISDSDLELQALIKIQKFVDTVSEMDLLLYQAKEGDIYYCKENKKLYVRSFNKWDMLDPLTSKVYVLVGLDEYNRTNIIHLWDGNDMVVMSERLFIGEVTGTAYDGGKGKHLADIANSLPDNVIREVADFTTDGSTVTFNYEYDVKQESGLFDGDAQGSKTIPSATTSNAGVMSATDKSKIDKIITNGNGTKYLSDNGTYNDMYVLSKDRDRRKSVSLVGEGFDENHWYPVSFTADPDSIVPPCNLIIWNSLNNDSAGISPKPSWATNSGGFVLHIDMTIVGSGYGQYYAKNKLNNWYAGWGGETAVGEMRQTTQTSTFYIYLRGGANYFYTSDYADLKMTAHSSEVLDGYNTYSIKDTQGDIKDFFTYVEDDLFREVKNLQIVHDNEFNFASDGIGNYVWINYRSRYDTVTSVKAVYVGNGQAGADGAYGAVHASGFFKESDIRLKSDISPLRHTLDQICEIPTVEFNMHDKHQIGTIAQDLENNFAEIVNTDSDGMKFVDYCMLGVVAIEGVKLLRQEIEDLKKQIQELKNGK